MKDKLEKALDAVSETYIAEAAAPKKHRRRPLWIGSTAAALAAAVLALCLWPAAPGGKTTDQSPTNAAVADLGDYRLAAPKYPVLHPYPLDTYQTDGYDEWWEQQRELHDQPEGYADSLQPYFAGLVSQITAQTEGENVACSPVNVYMALAMLAETSAGSSRDQLLSLLRADSIEQLRTQAGHVWRGHYNDDGLSTSILGSSLWLEEGYPVNEETANLLAEYYYASVFRGDLGSEEMNSALQGWLNEQTGGLLEEQVSNVTLPPRSVLALATTVNYKVQWIDWFSEDRNTEGLFHSPQGDREVTFMNTELSYGPYYWGEHFGAVSLSLEDNSQMWLFLPDEGYSPEQIAPDAMTFLAEDPYESENKKSLRVQLSVPKFDIVSQMDLVAALKELGVTEVFQPGIADFSPIITIDDGGCVDEVNHAARVAIDEQGVTAAAFTVIIRCGAGMPSTEEIDFVLDRPFFFVIESQDGLPLFTGVVNTP